MSQIAAEGRATGRRLPDPASAAHIDRMSVIIEPSEAPDKRSWTRAMARGLACRCPACGNKGIFKAFMKIADRCKVCGEELHHQRADDAPPYFTIFIVGHIVVPSVLIVEKLWHPDLWVHVALWLPVTLSLTVLLMPRVKAAIVGLQWALRMHGFGLAAPVKDAMD
jgi:uncharacterized protein (DUF983 family)